MSGIGAVFERARKEGRSVLVAYLCAGDPDLETTVRLVPRLAEAGAEIIELGVPFSDPIADGPVIQAASQRALNSGTTPAKVLEAVQAIRAKGCPVPLVLMTYMNPLISYGLEAFCAASAKAGVDGIIVPDLPLEEADDLSGHAEKSGLDLVLLAAPTTSPERLSRIGAKTRGFLYFVTVTGVTGARASLPEELPAQLQAARAASKAPVAAGFGISTPEQARALSAHADGVVVGSALVRTLAAPDGGPDAVVMLVRSLAEALRRA